ncbi:hypothetical protein P153DRAFT_385811 [Dothidotthia symphoricarpi CBS 119687]|uniref:HD domain-containing protein n=1 Tax=Dothidotthia symphoricarpi CBS 119687 TaxID=1392245 RepID=A0A6A6AES0_9PLEO|nr:uncharacterized protein P153DRAFT_385811 [Dothidotthia symphoricarpi CBS 119687]KAF2129605.1 hypothetical protein P153DRAFT_385811 [Dothidotthia symphoricarpi CBS 119687]
MSALPSRHSVHYHQHQHRHHTPRHPANAPQQRSLHPAVLSHSMRVYLYTRTLTSPASTYTPTAPKHNLLFTACLFHDISTAPQYNGRSASTSPSAINTMSGPRLRAIRGLGGQVGGREGKAPMVSWPGVLWRAAVAVAESEWEGVNRAF